MGAPEQFSQGQRDALALAQLDAGLSAVQAAEAAEAGKLGVASFKTSESTARRAREAEQRRREQQARPGWNSHLERVHAAQEHLVALVERAAANPSSVSAEDMKAAKQAAGLVRSVRRAVDRPAPTEAVEPEAETGMDFIDHLVAEHPYPWDRCPLCGTAAEPDADRTPAEPTAPKPEPEERSPRQRTPGPVLTNARAVAAVLHAAEQAHQQAEQQRTGMRGPTTPLLPETKR